VVVLARSVLGPLLERAETGTTLALVRLARLVRTQARTPEPVAAAVVVVAQVRQVVVARPVETGAPASLSFAG
jgi:hypothetical protein